MSKAWPWVPLKEILTPVSRPENVNPQDTYRILGAHWYAKGLYIKDVRTGSQIQAKHLFRVEQGDFVYNRLFAWKGSFAVATENNHGCYVSNEFLCFTINKNIAEVDYLFKYFSRALIWDEALSLSSGGTPTSRNRLKEEKLLSIKIPFPPLSEQQRIVAKIEELAKKVEEAKGLTWKAIVETKLVLDASIKNLFSKITSHSKIKTIVDINYGEGLRKQERIETGIYDVYGSGGLIGKHDKCITTTPFVIIGRKGSAGEITYSPNGGWVIDTAYYAIPKNNKMLLTKFFFYSLKSIDIKSGTIVTAIPGINRDSIYEKEIAFPSIDKQQRIIKYLDNLQSKIDKLKRFQNETQKELDALMPSILDKAFKGEL